MATGNPAEETTVRAVQVALDYLRATFGVAIILEMHCPHASNRGRRPIRPDGASAWLRWFEFGKHLAEGGTLTDWRTPRDAREWPPPALRRGGDWPWTVEDQPREQLWSRTLAYVDRTGSTARIPTLARELGASHGAVQRTPEDHAAFWAELKEKDPP